MAAGNNKIEAMLRIAADVAQAKAALRELRSEVKALKSEQGAAGSTSSPRQQAAEETQATQATTQTLRQAAAERKAIRDAERAANAKAAAERKAAAAAERKAAAEAAAAAKAARQEQVRTAQLAPQITDIVTGLAGGQNPLLVAVQQGGQLRDIFGSFGAAGRALLAVFTPLRIAAGLVAGAITLIGKAAYDGAAEQSTFNQQLAITGNTAATSFGQVGQIAVQVAQQQGAAIGAVRETVAALATSGQQSATTLAAAGRAASIWREITGASAEEAVKQFNVQADGASAWARRMNQAYNFLSAAEYQRIQQLEVSGQKQEAARLALEAYATTAESRYLPNLGLIERAWRGVERAISGAWDALKGIGREESAEDMVTRVLAKAEQAARVAATTANLGSTKGRARSEAELYGNYGNELQRLLARDRAATQQRAANQADENAQIERLQQNHQDALSNLASAAAQRRLAEQQAALSTEQSQLERRHAAGLVAEDDYTRRLADIEQRRLRARAAALQEQIRIEQGRAVDPKNAEVGGLAKDARVQALQGQLAQINADIVNAAAKATGEIEGRALARSQDQAKQWADTWTRAATEVRRLAEANAADEASQITNPLKRAEEEARLRVAEMRRMYAAMRVEIERLITPDMPEGMADKLRQQFQSLEREASLANANGSRRGMFESLRQQYDEQAQAVQLAEARIQAEVEQGVLTTEEAERAKFTAREAALPQLREILRLMRELARTPADQNAAEQASQTVDQLANRTTEFASTMRGAVKNSFAETFSSFVEGTMTAGEAFKGFIANVAKAALNLIAQRLGEQLALSLMPKSGEGGDWIGTAVKFIGSLFHSGGVVGAGAHRMTRAVSPLVWAGAQRYHTGGIGGLAPDEVPAILRKGEEVLTAQDPRHRANGGAAGVSVSMGDVVIQGAGGAEGDMRQSAQRLRQMMLTVVNDWATDESRPGGILAGR